LAVLFNSHWQKLLTLIFLAIITFDAANNCYFLNTPELVFVQQQVRIVGCSSWEWLQACFQNIHTN